jgi:hypothetical protein
MLVVVSAPIAMADPKPKPVDIKPIREDLLVLADPDGGIYVAYPGRDGRLWYGAPKSKNLYEQIVTSKSIDGSTGGWSLGVVAPRVPDIQPGVISRGSDGIYRRWCGRDLSTELTLVTGDKARTVIDKASFLSTALIRRPHMLARDDNGVYYYVDVLRKEYGGKGYRVFVGKKGAMKQRPLTDIATDSAGDVFATKTGDLRIIRATTTDSNKQEITSLSFLDLDVNSPLIYRDLGIYTFIGSMCESL